MVLQQKREAPVWGWAAPDEKITVAFAGHEASAVADAQGRWLTRLAVPLADGQPGELVVQGRNRVVFTNVVAGEVWLCSGQSNMKFQLGGITNAKAVIAAAEHPLIRLFVARMWAAPQPLPDLQGEWSVCSPATAAGVTAVGYFLARDLHAALGVPVGLIDSTSGGTAAEAWISQPTLEADPVLKSLVQPDPEFFQSVEQYDRDWTEYRKAQAERRTPLPPYPKPPFRGWGYPVSSFYNAMIAPLIPFAIQGVAWYQGEARTGRFGQYAHELSTLIRDWRARWGAGDFPFLIVQLPNINPTWNWPITREQQAIVARTLPRTGLVVTLDVGDPADLHPRNKEPIGRRLALIARALAYSQDVVHSGPVYESMTVDGNTVRLRFTQTDGGLAARDDGDLKGFVAAGTNQQFVAARARIEGDTVVVSAESVPRPVAVRYAFEDNPICNLINRAGLPAGPFRTDDWPLVPLK
jgi:sialate O-acetylesterase